MMVPGGYRRRAYTQTMYMIIIDTAGNSGAPAIVQPGPSAQVQYGQVVPPVTPASQQPQGSVAIPIQNSAGTSYPPTGIANNGYAWNPSTGTYDYQEQVQKTPVQPAN